MSSGKPRAKPDPKVGCNERLAWVRKRTKDGHYRKESWGTVYTENLGEAKLFTSKFEANRTWAAEPEKAVRVRVTLEELA